MNTIHPSILNEMRRRELDKHPERNVIPAMRTPESAEAAEPIDPPVALGRLATLASNVRSIAKAQLTGEPRREEL